MVQPFKIAYHEKNGKAVVRDYIEGLETKTKAKIYYMIELLRQRGWQMKYPDTEKVGDKIYALRVEYENNEYRLFYFFYSRDTIMFVHHVHKKSKKLRREDIDKAEKIRKEYL
jgi:phage-related protein